MRKWIIGVPSAIVVGLLIALNIVARSQAHDLIQVTPEEKKTYTESPADFDLAYEPVTLYTADGVALEAWYIPPENGRALIMLHGFMGHRATLLDEMATFAEGGYGGILLDQRAHGQSEGSLISFGYLETLDAEAAYEFLAEQPEVTQIGTYGESMGGATAIMHAAQNEGVQVVATNSPFASIEDTIEVSVTAFTGLPPFPFAPLMQFWVQGQYDGFSGRDIAPIERVGAIAPRPLLIMVAGRDTVVSPQGWLDARDSFGEHVSLWYEPALGHTAFSKEETFASEMLSFFAEGFTTHE